MSFLILASTAAVSPAEQELSRVEHEMRADGVPQPEIDEALAFVRRAVDVALTGRGRDSLDRALREAQGKRWARYPAVLQAGGTGKTADAILRITSEARDPSAVLSRVKCPVLAIYGALDQMVRVDENRPRLEKALRAGGSSDVSVVIVPRADHAFFPTKTGGHEELIASASGRIVFAPGFLEQMTEWLNTRVVGRRSPR